MEEYYPYTVIPQKVKTIVSEKIPLPNLPKLLPSPERVKRKYVGTIIFVLSVISFLLVNLSTSFSNIFAIYAIFFVALISLVAMIFEFVHYGKLKKQYLKEFKYYEDRQKAYKMVKQQIDEIERDNKNATKVNIFRQEKIHDFFAHGYDTMHVVQNKYSPAKKRFKLALEAYFSREILDNVKIVNRMKKINYVPDFVVKFNRPKINIAIEIEEPYSLSYVPENIQKDYEAKDRLRHRFASELAWVVIVLSEEQVVLHPTECCKFIEDAVANVLNDMKRNTKFTDIKAIAKQRIISGRERAKMRSNKYRETYLINAGLMDKAGHSTSVNNKTGIEKDKDDKKQLQTFNGKTVENKQVSSFKFQNNLKTSKPEPKIPIRKKEETKENAVKVSVQDKKNIATKKTQVELNNQNNRSNNFLKKENVNDKKKELVEKKTISDNKKSDSKLKRDYKSVDEILRQRKLDIQRKLEQQKQKDELKKEQPKEVVATTVVNANISKNENKDDKITKGKLEIKVAQHKLDSNAKRVGNERFKDVSARRETKTTLPRKSRKITVAEPKKSNDENAKKELIDSYHKQLESAMFDKKWDELINLCTKAIKDLPNWDWAYYRRSTAYGHKKEFDKVIADCDSAIRLNKRFAEAYYNRATAHYFMLQYANAVSDYDRAIFLDYVKPEDAHLNKGLCLYKLQKIDDAYNEFLKAKKLGCRKSSEILKKNFADKM